MRLNSTGCLVVCTGLFFMQVSMAMARCAEVISIVTHDESTTRYALSYPNNVTTGQAVTLVLLPGGGGHLDLDSDGCPQNLSGNSLVRSIPLFNARGFITALVDAPSNYTGEEGLGGFRTAKEHAQDLGAVIQDLRARTRAPVWLIGTSRGTISAVNAASRLQAPYLPDGVVLTSAVTSGNAMAKKAWVADTVFDLPLKDIRIPFLLVGHEDDKCIRTPPHMMSNVLAKINSSQQQMVTISGGPGDTSAPGVKACKGKSPHGFLGQEEEVVIGIDRFIRTGKF